MSLRPGQGCDVCMDSVCVEGREAEKWRCSRPVWSLLLQNKTSKHVPLTQCLDVDEKQSHASGSRDENVHQMSAFLGLRVSAWLKYIQIYVCFFCFCIYWIYLRKFFFFFQMQTETAAPRVQLLLLSLWQTEDTYVWRHTLVCTQKLS